ncbi:hypothetical protein JQ617_23745 [Bradyrhizobium sp. KB893862 SZCCT0404]|uniref:hypothetical protein n=1 Tax=Bradyrhizobium sp. KB893862 SZCCT0404 TaxID=2807672 RepID=UPI001BA62B93|nr:hypothetical protein [Bradyrhizobium sp. KB893862 SZCCT0404]MBR1176985.1 hypothetical protein [Bradyrhizobium sp. KB893862 SZCCT0404]
MPNFPGALLLSILSVALLGVTPAAQAEDKLPASAKLHANEASPDIYKLLAENEHFRVMLATWKAGQSDDWHTHQGDLVNYNLTDCELKGELPGGKMGQLVRKKGEAGFNTANSTHKVTNIGKDECVLLIVERK